MGQAARDYHGEQVKIRRKGTSASSSPGNLPDRFLSAKIDFDHAGEMTSLREYMVDLGEYLRATYGPSGPSAADVMRDIGIPPSEWYRAALEAGAGAEILAYKPAESPEPLHLEEARAAELPRPDLRVVR
jgi:hypothetical protein